MIILVVQTRDFAIGCDRERQSPIAINTYGQLPGALPFERMYSWQAIEILGARGCIKGAEQSAQPFGMLGLDAI